MSNNRYIVHTPNENFSGKVAGIQFNKGKAVVDNETLDESLGLDADQIAKMLEKDFGYTVEKSGGEAAVEKTKQK